MSYLDTQGTKRLVDNVKSLIAEGVPYLTVAPTADNTSGKLIFVVLSSDVSPKYNGYIYIVE